jgi:ribosome modulation factor
MDENPDQTADLDMAYEQGREAGLCGQSVPGQCPFTRAALDLRIAWLDGFSDGQWVATGGSAGGRLRNPFFGSGITTGVSRPHRL